MDYYALRGNWEDLLNESVIDDLIKISAFVPRRIASDKFVDFITGVSKDNQWTVLTSFYFDSVEGEYVLMDGKAESVGKEIFSYLSGLKAPEREAYFDYTLFGRNVRPLPQSNQSAYSYRSSSAPLSVGAILAPSGASLTLGQKDTDELILIDQLHKADGTGVLSEVYVRPAAVGYEAVEVTSDGDEIPLDATFTEEAGGLSVGFERAGITHHYSLGATTSLPVELPSSVYESIVDQEVVTGVSIDAGGLERISAAGWSDFKAQAISQSVLLPSNAYIADNTGSFYTLNSAGLDAAALEKVWSLWSTFSPVQPGTLFFRLQSDGPKILRPALLDASTLADLDAKDPLGLNLSTFFVPVLSDSGTLYAVDPNLRLDQQQSLSETLRLYRRDVQLFPYYDKGVSSHTLKKGLSQDDEDVAEAVFAAGDLLLYTSLNRSLVYDSGSLVPLSKTAYPGRGLEDRVSPSQGLADGGWKMSTQALVAGYDTVGRTTLRPRYVHVFDSRLDFAASDIVQSAPEVTGGAGGGGADAQAAAAAYAKAAPSESLNGGVYRWFYGVWNGRYDWDAAKFGTGPDTSGYGNYEKGSSTDSVRSRKVPPPPYYVQSFPNAPDREDHLEVWGVEGLPVIDDLWTGAVSERTESGFDDGGNVVSTTYQFAALIDRDAMWPSRRGGISTGPSLRRVPGAARGAP